MATLLPRLRPITEADHDDVLALNESNVAALAPMDRGRLVELDALADRFDVVDVQGEFGGFVITFSPGSSYDGEHYRWFTDLYADRFYYLDRIVLSERFRRQRLGTFVYDEIEHVAAKYDRLALEVNLQPRNDISLAFHAARGFAEVGRRGDETKLTSLMAKDLT